MKKKRDYYNLLLIDRMNICSMYILWLCIDAFTKIFPKTYLSIHQSTQQLTYLACVYRKTHLPTYLPIHPPAYLPNLGHKSTYSPTHPPNFTLTYLPTHPPTCLSTYPETHLTTHWPTTPIYPNADPAFVKNFVSMYFLNILYPNYSFVS